ncbi:hypothetical protein ACFYRN_39335 [Streptomyces sp. NPDC005227]|uniref:hypothetical protein n=1 Tax=Streptomyces sp. NPDC005227 TaxID=3364707 RepID=UPI00369DDD46
MSASAPSGCSTRGAASWRSGPPSLCLDPDAKLRFWAGQSVQLWKPTSHAGRGDAEVADLLDRSRHLFSDHVLRLRKWEAGVGS